MAVKKLLSVFLSFILLLSFTGTLVQAEETTSMSVEKAIQVFKQQGKRRGQWKDISLDIRKALLSTRRIRLSLTTQMWQLPILQMKRIQTKSCLFSCQRRCESGSKRKRSS